MTRDELVAIDNMVQTLRRKRNKQLVDALDDKIYIYNLEDLFRLLAELNVLHNHLCSELATDKLNNYCAWKHLATAYVLSNEVDGDCREIMDIAEALSGGKIKACQACSDDEAQLEQNSDVELDSKFNKL